MKRVAIAQNTLQILKAGFYDLPTGETVSIERELRSCLEQSQLYTPDTLSQIREDIINRERPFENTEFEANNETTLMGAERIARSQKFQKIGVLNFASAKNPGGGFLKGAQAQEESLARSSALYKSLLKCPQYYEFHRSHRSVFYSNHIIYSPSCPVFKTDEGILLKEPYCVDFITSPAPNIGSVLQHRPQKMSQIPDILRDRGGKVLSLAAYNGCDALVLGAWGCGVFRNDPSVVSQMFADYLLPNGLFWGRFKKVLFSVLDTTKAKKIFPEFESRFATRSREDLV
ncbi:MAG: TIGR02452 family protein [Cyanobacteriota bacterium]|nr:TIGR02452 family protein [Cyanobacteriota bacterium]